MSKERTPPLRGRWLPAQEPPPSSRQYSWLLLVPLAAAAYGLVAHYAPLRNMLDLDGEAAIEAVPAPPADAPVTIAPAATAAAPTPMPAPVPALVAPAPRPLPPPTVTEAQLLARYAERPTAQPDPTEDIAGRRSDGAAGLAEALRRGEIRLAASSDLERWKQRYAVASGRRIGERFDEFTRHGTAYLIQRDFVIPDGLSGANAVVFLLPPHAPFPRGHAGHSPILDLDSGGCAGMICSFLLDDR